MSELDSKISPSYHLRPEIQERLKIKEVEGSRHWWLRAGFPWYTEVGWRLGTRLNAQHIGMQPMDSPSGNKPIKTKYSFQLLPGTRLWVLRVEAITWVLDRESRH